jgi:hypothetical protein
MESTTTVSVEGDATNLAAVPDERQVYVQGLRDLADFLESNPGVPVDDTDSLGPWFSSWTRNPKDTFVLAVEALDHATVEIDGSYVHAKRAFGPITYKMTAHANDICETREELTTVSVLPEALARREAK